MADLGQTPIRIVILSPYPLVRTGLRTLIAAQGDMQVVGESEGMPEGLSIVTSCKPAIILLEVSSEGYPDEEVVPSLIKAWDQARIILLTAKNEAKYYLKAMQEGVLGIVFKTQPEDVLLKAIRKVNGGEVWIERAMVADLLTNISRTRLGFSTDPDAECIAKLSRRERQVIQLIGKGYKNQQIGAQLSISEPTVRRHLTSIYNKLGVSDRLELLIFANRNGLV